MTETLIAANGLRKYFGANRAVDGVSLQVRAGEIYGLVGSDGAGKTTTLRLMVGALLADGGEISVCGYDVKRKTEEARAQIGYLSQRFSLYEDLTVLENIRFFAEVRGLKSEEWQPRCMEILEFVGLANFSDRRAGQLSGGMKQKLGLATALVTRPRVLLLDEPTTGVDPVTRQDFWQLLIKLVSANGDGVAVLISTPYMDEAARASRVGFLHHGRLLVEGTPQGLRALLEGRILEVEGAAPEHITRLLGGIDGVEEAQVLGSRVRLRAASGAGDRIAADVRSAAEREGIDAVRAVPAAPSLEDVFRFLLQQGAIEGSR